MRGSHKFLVVVGVTAIAVGLSLGQGRPGGGRGGFGRFGGAKGSPVTLINNEAVKKELKLTDEQIAKVPDALWKALSTVLTPEQQKRLRQISLQQRGVDAFNDPTVQKALKLNADQKDAIKTALDTQQKEMRELFSAGGGGGGGFGQMREKMQEITKATQEKVTGVLSTAQKKQWSEMLGEEFKMPQFGGFGKGKGKGGFGKRKKKNDTEE